MRRTVDEEEGPNALLLSVVVSGDVDPTILAKCNPCLSEPCLNQGICHNDLVEIYRCNCPPGFKVSQPPPCFSPPRVEVLIEGFHVRARISY